MADAQRGRAVRGGEGVAVVVAPILHLLVVRPHANGEAAEEGGVAGVETKTKEEKGSFEWFLTVI